MRHVWVTADEVLAAKAAFVAAMPGWQTPVAHALGVAGADASIEWRVTNYPNIHQLPAVVLGTVLGHRSGSATYELDVDQLDKSIELLEPAGACPAFDHPNLWAWQQLRRELDDSPLPAGVRIVVVLLAHESDLPTDKAQRHLRATLHID